jgi:2-(1,2-epoxy-1,2-dihydrophenyl)acetyl-CoA isomerase
MLIEQHLQEAVLTLSLNRPEKINSFTRPMHIELIDALKQASNNPAVRCIVLQGNGRGFCAGQDLADLNLDPHGVGDQAATDLGDLVGSYFNVLIEFIAQLPKPVIAKVHGIAAGAGANLALACDLTIASTSSQFLQAFINIGLIPDSGGTWFLPALVGQQRAMGLAMLGEKLSGQQAADYGLIWKAIPDQELDAAVTQIATRLGGLPPRALAGIKKTVRIAATQTLTQQLTLEGQLQSELGKSADYFEGVSAFLQKRPARFTGA